MLVTVIRKPVIGTVAHNALEHGTGGLNIGECRIGTTGGSKQSGGLHKSSIYEISMKPCYLKGPLSAPDVQGRWPANVILTSISAQVLDDQSGVLRARGNINNTSGGKTSWFTGFRAEEADPGDSGGASRFFYSTQ